MSVPELQHAFESILAGDLLTEASKFINTSVKKQQSMQSLFKLLDSPNPGVRQLSAIFLRKMVARHWNKLHNNIKQEFRRGILGKLIVEPNRDVRNALAELCGRLSKILMPSNQWPEIFQVITNSTVNPDPIQREAAFRLLQALGQHVGPHMAKTFSAMQPLLLKGLQDSENAVRIRSLRAVNAMVPELEDPNDAVLMRSLVEPMVMVVQYCIQNNLGEDVLDSVEVFGDLLEQDLDFLEGFLEPLVHFMLQLLANPNLDMLVRDKGSQFIQQVSLLKPRQFLERNWLAPLLAIIPGLLAEDIDEEFEETPPLRVIAILMTSLGPSLPGTYGAPPTLLMVNTLINSGNWRHRRGGLEILAVISAGWSTDVGAEFERILPALAACFRDQEAQVRMAACVAMGHFSESITEEVLEHHAQIMELLAGALGDPDREVVLRALYGLQFFTEELGPLFKPYADPVMQRALALIHSGDPEIKETAFGVVSSVAMALQKEFLPYFGATLSQLQIYMPLTVEEAICTRARATECAGQCVCALGREVLGDQLIGQFSELAFQGLSINGGLHTFQLREFSWAFFLGVATEMGPDFKPMFQRILPILISELESNEGIVANRASASGLESLVEDDITDEVSFNEMIEQRVDLSISTDFIAQKSVVTATVGVIARAMGGAMMEFMSELMPRVIALAQHIHAQVREQAVSSLASLACVVHKVTSTQQWTKGAFSEPTASPDSIGMFALVTPHIISMIKEDRNLECVCAALKALGTVLVEVGPNVMPKWIGIITEILVNIFRKNLYCQAMREHFDEDDRDLDLFNCAGDVAIDVMRLCGSTGPGVQFFLSVMDPINTLFQDNQTTSNRSLAIGVMADMLHHLDAPLSADLMRTMVTMCMKAVQNAEDEMLRRNGLYAAAMVIKLKSPEVAGQLLQIAAAVCSVVEDPHQSFPVRDNAAGALAQIILAGTVNELIALSLISLLPLKMDPEPAGAVFHAVINLLRNPSSAPIMQPHLPVIITSAVRSLLAVKQMKLLDDSRPTVELMVRMFLQSNPGIVRQVVANLSPSKQQAFAAKFA